MLRSVPTIALLCVALSPLCAQTVTLNSDQVLRVHFTIPSTPNIVPDVLQIWLGTVTVTAAHTTRTATLWNGGTLLGTAQSSSFGGYSGLLSLSPANSWRQSGSVWNFDSPGDVADFSSLQNATIQGIIDFSLATGSFTLNPANVSLFLARANTANSSSQTTPQPVISEVVVVPKLTGPLPGTINAVNTWTTTGAGSSSLMAYAVGFAVSPFLVPVAPPVFFDLAPPLTTLITFADPGGASALSFFVPPIGSGVTVFTQSVELTGSGIAVANFVRHTFP